MIKIFAIILFFTVSTFASSPPISRITKKQVASLSDKGDIFEADTISYSKFYMTNGVVHDITDKQLKALRQKAYEKLGDDMDFMRTTYGQLLVCHIVEVKVTKVISGNAKVGDVRRVVVSDHIDSMCPHFKSYETIFKDNPSFVWLIDWEKTGEAIKKQIHSVATTKEYNSL